MKQKIFFPKAKPQHGGSLALNKRKNRRPLNFRKPVHLVLRSDLAKGKRSLLRNKRLVLRVLSRYAERFKIRVYETAVCGNHLHCLARGYSRRQLQNFFRVVAGQIAQQILTMFPLQRNEKKAYRGGTHPKSQKTVWSFLAYTRVVSWGWDFYNVKAYVFRNTLEALGLIVYNRLIATAVACWRGRPFF